jgi:hypothetical protein
MLRELPTAFALAWVAFLCIVGTQLVFWTFTQPVDRVTANWTFLPGDWSELRRRWEYSHAACAGLNLAALVALVVCLLWTNEGARWDTDAVRRIDPATRFQQDDHLRDGPVYAPTRDDRRAVANARYM